MLFIQPNTHLFLLKNVRSIAKASHIFSTKNDSEIVTYIDI